MACRARLPSPRRRALSASSSNRGVRNMASTKDIFRAASIFAVLAAGSCAAPDGTPYGNDPMPNHPITVEPSYHKLRLPFSVSESGLMPDDAQRFSDFVEGYVYHGNGAISISVP